MTYSSSTRSPSRSVNLLADIVPMRRRSPQSSSSRSPRRTITILSPDESLRLAQAAEGTRPRTMVIRTRTGYVTVCSRCENYPRVCRCSP